MADDEHATNEDPRDEGLAPEVPTTFATKGLGWSGREEDGPEILESDTPPRPHGFRRSRPAAGE